MFRLTPILSIFLLFFVIVAGNHGMAQFPSQGNGLPQDADLLRANQAVYDLMTRRTENLPGGWIFGPNLDDAYFYRVRFSDLSDMEADDRTSQQRRRALRMGIPMVEGIPFEERELLMLLIYRARRSRCTDSTQALIIKHFPGGPRILEHTEHVRRPLVLRGGRGFWDPSARRFVRLAQGLFPPAGIMTSHACHPDLEQELAGLHPELTSLIPNDSLIPVTFSPRLLKGYLREELGYTGIIVSDWVDMGAINRYLLDRRASMPADLRSMSSHAQVTILAIHAGVTLITGMKNRLARDRRPRGFDDVVRECAEWSAQHPTWENDLRASAQALIRWAGARGGIPDSVVFAIHPSFSDCLRWVWGEMDGRDPAWLQRWTLARFQDLWNRQGVLHLFWRATVLSKSLSSPIPPFPLSFDDERVVTKDREWEWVQAMRAIPDLDVALGRMSWDSPLWRLRLAEALRREWNMLQGN